MCPNSTSTACRWDGSPRDTRPRRPLRVAATSPSRLLRTGQSSRCRACGNPIAGHQAQMAFLLANYAGNASLVAALLGTGVRTVRRHCRGWPPPPGLRLRRALHRRVVDLVCPRCLSDRAVEQARQANREARRAARRLPRDPGGMDR
ncbi:hypothetical protein ACFWXZ_18640 [[Kitasatospora] papulosa]|uniref:hypothetical protein n=1 Tax=[Kitasatospora] papulosa TaxID=1464011 RepID=UPI0036991D78